MQLSGKSSLVFTILPVVPYFVFDSRNYDLSLTEKYSKRDFNDNKIAKAKVSFVHFRNFLAGNIYNVKKVTLTNT